MKKNKSFKKILIVLFVFAVFLGVLHYFMYKDIRSRNEKISVLQDDLSTQSEKRDYLISTDRILKSIEKDLGIAQGSVISKEGDVGFIENMESIARRNGLEIEIESLVLESQKLLSPDLTVLNIKAKTTGSWIGTYTFLAEIESLPFKLEIRKSSLVNSGGGIDETSNKILSSSGVWKGSIDISVLKYK